jgi:selenocysteine lyase/cysteine desulfurase
VSWRRHFSRFLSASPERLHFAAHSHHLWPDVSFEAQERAWRDAAELVDGKWGRVLGEILPKAQRHVARTLGLSDPASVVFAPNTHEFLLRILSCLERRPVRVLTTDAEFHSFRRQSLRWEEAGVVEVERVAAEPFATFADRFLESAGRGGHDLVFASQVFFNSAFVFDRFAELADVSPDRSTFLVIDGYHGFMALPTDLAPIEERVFYLAGGYKYAMSGEGVCFLHCPPGYGARPVDTGWFAGFDDLERGTGKVSYADDGGRFLGSTFDPSGLYRFVAVMDLWESEGVAPSDIHEHVRRLQESFLRCLDDLRLPGLTGEHLVPDRSFAERGHFLTFRLPNAAQVHGLLKDVGVITDLRADRLRFGFGIYQDESDVEELGRRLRRVLGGARAL